MILSSVQHLSIALVTAIFQTFWQGLLVGLVLIFILKMIPKTNANFRYVLSFSSIICILVLFIGNTIYYFPHNSAAEVESQLITSIPISSTYIDHTPLKMNDVNKLVGGVVDVVHKNAIWISLIWFMGVLFGYVRLIYGLFNLNKFNRYYTLDPLEDLKDHFQSLATKLRLHNLPKLKLCEKITAPATYGWLKPVVLIPLNFITTLTPDQLDMIILHELAHIKRNDFLFNIIKSIAQTLLFFHPVVWWASSLAEKERENVCDDMVLSLNNKPVDYANTLMAVAEYQQKQLYATLSISGNKNHFVSRIERIFNYKNKTMAPKSKIQGRLVIGLLSIFTVLAVSIFFDSKGQDVSLVTKNQSSDQLYELKIEVYNVTTEQNNFGWDWTDDKSMIIKSKSGVMPTIIFNDKKLPPFKSGEIPTELKNMSYVSSEAIIHELTEEEENEHKDKWPHGLIKISLTPVDQEPQPQSNSQTEDVKPTLQTPDSSSTSSVLIKGKSGDTSQVKAENTIENPKKNELTKETFDSIKIKYSKERDLESIEKVINQRNNDPDVLVLIDGKKGDINNLKNRDQIYSISVLKEGINVPKEDLIAIYGEEAANGVILITTKEAKNKNDAADTLKTGIGKASIEEAKDQVEIRPLNMNDPDLPVFIDGKKGDIGKIPPDQIHAVTVYKNQDLSALYGKEANRGIILVTTKKGLNKVIAPVKNSSLYPNPLTDQSVLELEVVKSSHIVAALYDHNGKLLNTIINENLSQGIHTFEINKSSLSPGYYIILINNGDRMDQHKFLVE